MKSLTELGKDQGGGVSVAISVVVIAGGAPDGVGKIGGVQPGVEFLWCVFRIYNNV